LAFSLLLGEITLKGKMYAVENKLVK